jgi:uncharacterized phage protein gp47/JayE
MPAPYGVTPTGFSRPSVQELLALIEADQRAEISQTLDLSSDSVLGQYNGIVARQLGVAWEAAEAVHDGNDPDRAEDDAATSLAKITGTDREGASKSLVPAQVRLEIGTTLVAGTHFAHVTGKPDVRFTPTEDFTAPGPASPATYELTFEAENTGPTQAAATTLTVIATPVVGWVSVNNDGDAVPGRAVDDDADLRVRRERALALSGSSGVDQIRADILAVENVTSCQVFENWTDAVDSQGLPAKSFEVVLFDDAGADDDAVAQAIWDSKPGGIQSYGQTGESGTALDKNGTPHVMAFSRATTVPMYIACKVTPKDGYVGDAEFKLQLATNLDTAMGTGDDVSEWDISDAAHGLGAKVSQIRFGTAPAPTLDEDVPIGNRSIARFDTSRITFTA